jgi:hypothetical protein
MIRKKIIVFVKNKLITLDTVLPLLLEAKDRYGIPSEIVVFDDMAHDAIEKNVVLKDTINYVGRELFITKGEKVKILRRTYILYSLFILLIGFIKGNKIIHFGRLNTWPFKFISLLFKKNTYQMQGTAFSFKYSQDNRSFKKLVHPPPVGKNIILSAKNIQETAFYNSRINKKIFYFGETRTRSSWVEYIDKRSDYYFKKYHPNIDLNKGFIVFILGVIDGLEYKYELFKSTIETLSSLKLSVPILIKPHAYTEMDTVKAGIKDLDSFHVTYLHPSLLASRARVFICNSFSNTFADARSYGVKTIEYTHYDTELIKRTNGKSVSPEFVDYFIQNDNNQLAQSISEVFSQKYKKSLFKGHVRSDDGLFESFIN